jgi:MraZ protein
MALFLSTFVNKVDKKGRVSVPSPFRVALAAQGFSGVVVFPSISLSAIEGWGLERMEALSAGIDDFDPFSDESDAFTLSILADSHQLAFDTEGRVVVPDALLAHAGITEYAAFVGRGAAFQIWQPEAFRVSQEAARKMAKENRLSLKLSRREG